MGWCSRWTVGSSCDDDVGSGRRAATTCGGPRTEGTVTGWMRRVVRPLIGFDAFSYHRYFGETLRWEEPVEDRWSTDNIVDRAIAHAAEAVSLQTCYLPIDPSSPAGVVAVAELGSRFRQRGLRTLIAWGHRDGLRSGRSPERVEEARSWIAAAAALDLPLVRIVAGCVEDWSVPPQDRIERLVPVLRDLAAFAGDLGIDLALENHADFRMADLIEMVERVDSGRLGLCLDLGNLARVGDDVVEATRIATPHVRMVHVKDLRVPPSSVGDPDGWWPTVPLGEGDTSADGSLDAALVATLASPGLVGWFVETVAMHPDAPDEDAAVAKGIASLGRRREGIRIRTSGPRLTLNAMSDT